MVDNFLYDLNSLAYNRRFVAKNTFGRGQYFDKMIKMSLFRPDLVYKSVMAFANDRRCKKMNNNLQRCKYETLHNSGCGYLFEENLKPSSTIYSKNVTVTHADFHIEKIRNQAECVSDPCGFIIATSLDVISILDQHVVKRITPRLCELYLIHTIHSS